MDPLLGMIAIFGFNFAPRGWALCAGQILPISQNTALFSLLGTMYGGDGRTTFALPDLRGRVPIGMGLGNGLSDVLIGEFIGSENKTILTSNLPSHTHNLMAVSDAGDQSIPTGAFLANTGTLDREYKTSGSAVQMNQQAIGLTGGGQPINIQQPSLGLNFCIALQGIFPSRN